MDRLITFTTDAATLAVFDLDVLEQRIEDEVDWWATEFHQLPEVAAGLIALVGLGGDGTYTVRIGDGDLEPVEKAYAAEFVTLGLEVVSGRILVGAGECLPGAGEVALGPDFEPFFVELAPGPYLAWIFRLRWHDSPRFAPDQLAAGVPQPPDLVILLRQREEPFYSPESEPRLLGAGKSWLYPDEPREVGPAAGMVFTTKVVLRGGEKLLKPVGTLNYRPVLADMNGLAWRDEVEIRVLAVHPESETYTAELIRKLPRAD